MNNSKLSIDFDTTQWSDHDILAFQEWRPPPTPVCSQILGTSPGFILPSSLLSNSRVDTTSALYNAGHCGQAIMGRSASASGQPHKRRELMSWKPKPQREGRVWVSQTPDRK